MLTSIICLEMQAWSDGCQQLPFVSSLVLHYWMACRAVEPEPKFRAPAPTLKSFWLRLQTIWSIKNYKSWKFLYNCLPLQTMYVQRELEFQARAPPFKIFWLRLQTSNLAWAPTPSPRHCCIDLIRGVPRLDSAGQETIWTPPFSNLRSFESKCTVLKRVLATFWDFSATPIIRCPGHCASLSPIHWYATVYNIRKQGKRWGQAALQNLKITRKTIENNAWTRCCDGCSVKCRKTKLNLRSASNYKKDS